MIALAKNKQEVIALGAVVLVGFFVIMNARKVAQASAAAAVNAVGGAVVGAAEGTILGIGDVLGVPRTDTEKCKAACAAGNAFDAMAYCTVGEYTSWVIHGAPSNDIGSGQQVPSGQQGWGML